MIIQICIIIFFFICCTLYFKNNKQLGGKHIICNKYKIKELKLDYTNIHYININGLYSLLTPDKLQKINIELIEYYPPKNMKIYKQRERYKIIKIDYPIILLKDAGIYNSKKKYRLIDGKHRLIKLKSQKYSQNITQNIYINSYVLDINDIKNHIYIYKQ